MVLLYLNRIGEETPESEDRPQPDHDPHDHHHDSEVEEGSRQERDACAGESISDRNRSKDTQDKEQSGTLV